MLLCHQIQFWKTAEGQDYSREVDYILYEPETYPRPRGRVQYYYKRSLPDMTEEEVRACVLCVCARVGMCVGGCLFV